MRRLLSLAAIAGLAAVACAGNGVGPGPSPDPGGAADVTPEMQTEEGEPDQGQDQDQGKVPDPARGPDPGAEVGTDAIEALPDPGRDAALPDVAQDLPEEGTGIDVLPDSPPDPGLDDPGVPPVDLPLQDLPPADIPSQDPGSPPAACPYGTWESPCPVGPLPATLAADTSLSTTSSATAYSPCAPAVPEAGPEVVYALTILQDGILHLSLDDVPGDAVDNDVHLLSGTGPDSCVGRDNLALKYPVKAGEAYRIAIDSWSGSGAPKPGPFVLSVWLVPSATGTCPADMEPVGEACMDRYEAPNLDGALPLVMYSFVEAAAWCESRGRRLCFDDEWTAACEGAGKAAYPYGSTHVPGICHDEEKWLPYDQTLLNGWPGSVSAPEIESLGDLLAAASAVSPKAKAAADHVLALYQGSPSGLYAGCVNESGVLDLVGNVEEWTRRRDGGTPQFHGNLKGRYWAESRTCQQGVTTHGDGFRFYEIGFRCCLDP